MNDELNVGRLKLEVPKKNKLFRIRRRSLSRARNNSKRSQHI
jgi:hypothetical protein